MPLITNLVGDWLLNGTSVVNSVDSHTETAFGSPTMQHSAAGHLGVQLTGGNMGFTGESGNNFSSTANATMSGFMAFYCENATPSAPGPLFSKRDASEEWAFYLSTALKGNLLWADSGGTLKINLTSGGAITPNALQTFGFTFDPTVAAGTVYTNGTADGSSTVASFLASNNGNPLLLCGESAGARSFPGTVFRLSLWKSRLLTPIDFASLHASPFQDYSGNVYLASVVERAGLIVVSDL